MKIKKTTGLLALSFVFLAVSAVFSYEYRDTPNLSAPYYVGNDSEPFDPPKSDEDDSLIDKLLDSLGIDV